MIGAVPDRLEGLRLPAPSYFFFDHRALAALTAMAFRLLAESAFDLAFPPLSPPFRPMDER